MKDDFKGKLGDFEEDPYSYLSHTNCILKSIDELSKRMDKAEAESRAKEKSELRRFVFSSVLGLLAAIAGIVAAVAAVISLLPD